MVVTDSETSYGVIPLFFHQKGDAFVLMVRQTAGHWSFPKGHALDNESPQATAQRELYEETGLVIGEWIHLDPITEQYSFYRDNVQIKKQCVYFFARVGADACHAGSSDDASQFPLLKLQAEEIAEAVFAPIDGIEKIATFPEMKRVCKSVQEKVQHISIR